MASTPTVGSTTRASTLYEHLRRDLLAGQHAPGGRLRLETLMQQYGVGQTPLREALNRLVADGLVERREQRGFAVPPISPDDLREITDTRCWLESLALRQSIERGDAAWEDTLVLAAHRLAGEARLPEGDTYAENPVWESRHRQLHHALLAACGSRWLLRFCEQLADQWYRYRQLVVVRSLRERDVPAEHQAIVSAALARDAEQACHLLTEHYRATAALLLDDVTSWGQTPGAR